MAIEVFEGFDTFSLSQVTRRYPLFNAASFSSMISPGRYSQGQALQLNTFSGTAYLQIPVTARTEYFGGFDFYAGAFTGSPFTVLTAASAIICQFTLATGGQLQTTFGNSSTGVLLTNTWQNIQWHLIISASVGVLQVKVDGVMVINLSSLNTGTTPIGNIYLLGNYNASPTFDNLWVMNTTGSHSNSFPGGAMIVYALYPDADSSPLQWTPNTGITHYTLVNQTIADDDSTYVSATTAGYQDTYNINSLTGSIAQVHSVMTSAVARKDDVPSKIFTVSTTSGATTATTSNIYIPQTYTSCILQMNDDPNTSAQWNVSAVNAIQVGIEVVA